MLAKIFVSTAIIKNILVQRFDFSESYLLSKLDYGDYSSEA